MYTNVLDRYVELIIQHLKQASLQKIGSLEATLGYLTWLGFMNSALRSKKLQEKNSNIPWKFEELYFCKWNDLSNQLTRNLWKILVMAFIIIKTIWVEFPTLIQYLPTNKLLYNIEKQHMLVRLKMFSLATEMCLRLSWLGIYRKPCNC